MISFLMYGNKEIGMGHFMRCLGIAEILQEKGIDVLFVTSQDSDTSILKNKGLKILKMHSQSYALNKNEIAQIIFDKKISTLFIDSYLISNEEYSFLRQKCHTICFDDLNNYDCDVDIIINSNLDVDPEKYKNSKIVSRKICYGPKFIPLRKEFLGKRKEKIARRVKRVTMTTGSTDPFKCILQILDSIEPDKHPNIEFRIIIGVFYSFEYKCEIKARINMYNNVKLLAWDNDFASIILESDLIISSGSSTVFEALSLNVPCITIQFMDNHYIECYQLSQLGFSEWAGNYDGDEADINTNKKLKELFKQELSFEKRKKQSDRFSKAFDGQGTYRIVNEIVRLDTML